MTQQSYSAPALEKGVAIVELLADAQAPMTMIEISEALSRSKHELYRMLMSLERLGWLRRLPGEKFALTNRLFDLAMRAPPSRNLHEAALPIMRKLSEDLQQSCHMAVISGSDIVIVARMESPGLLGFAVRVGYRVPIHQSTSGRLLYGLSLQDAKDAIDSAISTSAPSKADMAAFLKDATIAQKKGLLIVPSRTVASITDIAVPIRGDHDGHVIAALTVPFLPGSTAINSVEKAATYLLEAANRISQTLDVG